MRSFVPVKTADFKQFLMIVMMVSSIWACADLHTHYIVYGDINLILQRKHMRMSL